MHAPEPRNGSAASAATKLPRVSVIGLGKLGASMAASLASRGFEVVGVDVLQRVVDQVNAGLAPVAETGLEAMIATHRERLRATTDHRAAIRDTDVSFVIVPTPSDPRGAFSLQYASFAMREIGEALKGKDTWHLVVMTSTVLPGACRHGLVPLLEEGSGKRAGEGFGFCYSPEFIALGTVIRDFLHPDFNLIGEWDARSGDVLEQVYTATVLNGAPSRRMSLENAELAKVALNSYVTMKITFANTLADICNRLPGGDVDAVTGAIGLDARIGRKYLSGGMGFGGPCFPRDNRAFAFIARTLGSPADLAEATDRLNQVWLERLVDAVKRQLSQPASVAILGLAYKPESVVVEASPSIALAQALVDAGHRVSGHDPLASHNARAETRHRIIIQEHLGDALRNAQLVLITTPDPQYRGLSAADFANCAPGCIVWDCWRLLQAKIDESASIVYRAHGQCPSDARTASTQILRSLWSAPS